MLHKAALLRLRGSKIYTYLYTRKGYAGGVSLADDMSGLGSRRSVRFLEGSKPGIGMRPEIPEQRHPRHFARVTVQVHEYPDGTLAVFHGPRRLAGYRPDATLIEEDPATRSAA